MGPDVTDKNAERQAFYKEMLSLYPTRPERDFERFCTAWLAATGAEWVWLWLFNPYTDEWEIRHVTCRQGDSHISKYVLPSLTSPHNGSVTEYAYKTRQPVRVSSLAWSESLNGVHFSVACRAELEAMGCVEFITIPFSCPEPTQADLNATPLTPHVTFHGAVCVHFTVKNAGMPHPPSSLLLMAALTANAIVTSFQAVKLEMALRLTELAEEVLTVHTRKVAEVRAYYLDTITAHIIDCLRVKAVSFFYHDQYYTKVTCISSTGLCDRQKNPIPRTKLHKVSYLKGVGRTGACFLTGQIDVFSSEVAKQHEWIYSEMLSGRQVGAGGAVICPIPMPSEKAASLPAGSPRCHGVVRCSQREVLRQAAIERPFDPITVHLLQFIARQIGPVLETLSAKELRERTISVVKHDLYAPLEMIRNTAATITTAALASQAGNRGINLGKYDLQNLESAALIAAHHVGELDLDPASASSLRIENVFLLNAVVARISNLLNHVAERDNGMHITFEGFQSIPKLWVDVRKIERVFVNIIMNAIKYGEENSTIHVRAYAAKNEFRVEIRNRGDGVSAHDADRIFDLGFRSESVRRKKQGVGLGLYIARGIMEAHRGNVMLTGLRDPTEFTIVFPTSLRFDKPR